MSKDKGWDYLNSDDVNDTFNSEDDNDSWSYKMKTEVARIMELMIMQLIMIRKTKMGKMKAQILQIWYRIWLD